jgi:hypothetical protein
VENVVQIAEFVFRQALGYSATYPLIHLKNNRPSGTSYKLYKLYKLTLHSSTHPLIHLKNNRPSGTSLQTLQTLQTHITLIHPSTHPPKNNRPSVRHFFKNFMNLSADRQAL